jgi:phage tail-like protein
VSSTFISGRGNSRLIHPVRFVVLRDSRPLDNLIRVTGLEVTAKAEPLASGGEDVEFTVPGRLSWPNLEVTAGVGSHSTLREWMFDVKRAYDRGQKLPSSTVTVQLNDSLNLLVREWVFINAYPISWKGPELSVDSQAVATETLVICHGGLATSE